MGRLHLTRGLEGLLARCGYGRIAGVDEVGRGALAGPVVAAAVVMDPDCLIPGVDDSKTLSREERVALATLIRRHALAIEVREGPPARVDRAGIGECVRAAMAEALAALDPRPQVALVDAVGLSGLPFPCVPLVRGDHLCYSIACASIVAKVARDARMVELDSRFPQYGFARHMGYGAEEHRGALERFGPCVEHRLTFGSVLPTRAAGRA